MLLTRCFPPLALLRELERYFGCEVTAATFFESEDTGSQTPPGWAKGDYIVLPKGMLSPLRAEGIFFIAHEVCHLRQQAENVSMTRRQAETDADFHATVFTWQYLNGRRCTPAPKLLPLADAAAVPAAAWGLGGLFSLKQYIADKYTKIKGYAYFFLGPHEWLTIIAAQRKKRREQNYVTNTASAFDTDSLVLGAQMNDMYILPEKIKAIFDPETLRLIGEALEQADFGSVTEFSFDTSAIEKEKDAFNAGMFENYTEVISQIAKIDFGFVLWYTLFSNFLRTSRFIAILREKKKNIDEKIEEAGVTKNIKKKITDGIRETIQKIGFNRTKPGNALFSFSLELFVMDTLPIRAGIDMFLGAMQMLAYKDTSKAPWLADLLSIYPPIKEWLNTGIDPNKKIWYENRVEEKIAKHRFNGNEGQKKLVEAITLFEIWWNEDESIFADIEAFFSGNVRELVKWKKQLENGSERPEDFVANHIHEVLSQVQIPEVDGMTLIVPEVLLKDKENCESFFCLPDVEFRGKQVSLDSFTKVLNKGVQAVNNNVLNPTGEAIVEAVRETISVLVKTALDEVETIRDYYNAFVFLLGSHTGELQFLHSMDCSGGSVEWNREKMLRWCEFCYDCNRAGIGENLLNQNIYEFLDKLVPAYFSSESETTQEKTPVKELASKDPIPMTPTISGGSEPEVKSANSHPPASMIGDYGRYLTDYGRMIDTSLGKYRDYFQKHEKDLLLAAMLLPLCCVKMQMNNCRLAARQVCNIPMDNEDALSRKQAREYDICMVVAMKISLQEEDENSLDIGGKYRTPIADMTFREFFTGARKGLSAPDILCGMAMHMIEDSFTPSHTIRSWNLNPGEGSAPIITFADYTKQDSLRHACADYFVNPPSTLSINESKESEPMDINSKDGSDMMDIDSPDNPFDVSDGKFEKKQSETKTDLRKNLPLRAAEVTVGAESAIYYAQDFFNQVQGGKRNMYQSFSRARAEAIYPLIQKRLAEYNNSCELGCKVTDEKDQKTPASGRCFESEELEKESLFDKKIKELLTLAKKNEKLTKNDLRFDELQKRIGNYREYLLKHFAKNLYPNQDGLRFYETKKEKSYWEKVSDAKAALGDAFDSEYWTGELGGPGEFPGTKQMQINAVLDMYQNNDLPFLRDILTSRLLCEEARKEFEDIAKDLNINEAVSVAEMIERTRDRYLKHLNELILNVVGIYLQTKDESLKTKACDVVKKAKKLKTDAEAHWLAAPSSFLLKIIMRMGEQLEDYDESVRFNIFVLTHKFNIFTMGALIRGLLTGDNSEEFALNAGKMLDIMDELLEKNRGDQETKDKVKKLRKKYDWLSKSIVKELPSEDENSFCLDIAKIIKESECLNRRSWWGSMKLPEGIEQLLIELRKEQSEFFDDDESPTTADAGSATEGTDTILADGVSLYESLLSRALDLAKGGKSTSDVAEEWLGEGVSMESVERMGRSFRNALKNA